MPNWNSGYVFNRNADEFGFFWNGADYLLMINLHETLSSVDNLSLKLARLVLNEKFDDVYEQIVISALTKVNEDFKLEDEMSYGTLFYLADSFGIKDEFSDLIVLAFLHDKIDIIEQAKVLSTYLSMSDNINVADITSVDALLNIVDELGLEDLFHSLKFILTMHDGFNMTDRSPRAAISDFIIGVQDELDKAYDWFIPFGMKVDYGETQIQVIPQAELTTIEMPGIDGSIVEDTVYKDRLFQIVTYSELGLTIQEKEELKGKITDILNSTKNKAKKLTIQDRGVSFDVRYEGKADITEGPSFVKSSIPLRVGAYGYDTFEQEVIGSGLILNNGDAPLGVRHTIDGPITNPTFQMGEITYKYVGTIQTGYSLIIDQNLLTCYLKNPNGIKKNAMSNFSGKFQKIPARTSVALNAGVGLETKLKTEWRNRVLW